MHKDQFIIIIIAIIEIIHTFAWLSHPLGVREVIQALLAIRKGLPRIMIVNPFNWSKDTELTYSFFLKKDIINVLIH